MKINNSKRHLSYSRLRKAVDSYILSSLVDNLSFFSGGELASFKILSTKSVFEVVSTLSSWPSFLFESASDFCSDDTAAVATDVDVIPERIEPSASLRLILPALRAECLRISQA